MYKAMVLIICTVLTGAIVVLAGCPSEVERDSIDIDSSREYNTILPQFANFPVIATSVSATLDTLVVKWVESYPVIKEYGEVIAVFPHSIEGWHVSDPRFQFNTKYNLLKWKQVREQGRYKLDIFDENSELRYKVVVIASIASQFLDDVYTSIAGADAVTMQILIQCTSKEIKEIIDEKYV